MLMCTNFIAKKIVTDLSKKKSVTIKIGRLTHQKGDDAYESLIFNRHLEGYEIIVTSIAQECDYWDSKNGERLIISETIHVRPATPDDDIIIERNNDIYENSL